MPLCSGAEENISSSERDERNEVTDDQNVLYFCRHRSLGWRTDSPGWFENSADVSEVFDLWQDAQHLKEEVGPSERRVPCGDTTKVRTQLRWETDRRPHTPVVS